MVIVVVVSVDGWMEEWMDIDRTLAAGSSTVKTRIIERAATVGRPGFPPLD